MQAHTYIHMKSSTYTDTCVESVFRDIPLKSAVSCKNILNLGSYSIHGFKTKETSRERHLFSKRVNK